jgi:hypothetical protein
LLKNGSPQRNQDNSYTLALSTYRTIKEQLPWMNCH